MPTYRYKLHLETPSEPLAQLHGTYKTEKGARRAAALTFREYGDAAFYWKMHITHPQLGTVAIIEHPDR